MRTVQPDYGHTIQPTGEGYAIAYRHKKPSFWLGFFYVFVATVVLSFPVAGVLNHTVRQAVDFTNGTLVLSALALSAMFGLLLVLYRHSRRPAGSTIVVSRHYLEAGGKRYERQHIRELYAKAPHRQEFGGPVIQNRDKNLGFIALGASGALGGGGIAAAGLVGAHQAVEDAGRALTYGLVGGANAWNRTRGWSIWIDYGAKKPMRIAHRIDEAHIQPLMNDLENLLRSQRIGQRAF